MKTIQHLFICVLSGDLEGKEYPLADKPLLIGRNTGDIPLPDKNVSKNHALIEKDADGLWNIVDQNSSNGILYNGKKHKSIHIKEGMEFSIGKTKLSIFSKKKKEGSSQKTPSDDKPTPQSSPEELNHIISTLKERLDLVKNKNEVSLNEFSQPLKLKFLSGIFTPEVWTLDYGPRTIGPESVDLCLPEDDLTPAHFIIDTKENEFWFETKFSKQITINGEYLDKKKLISGDIIYFGESALEVVID